MSVKMKAANLQVANCYPTTKEMKKTIVGIADWMRVTSNRGSLF